jgi:outer membrane lipoprotein LolB
LANRFMRFAHLLFVLALAACAQLPGQSVDIQSPGDFELAGRVVVKAAEEGANGTITWRHSRDADDLFIASPFGQGIARVARSGERVRLTTSEGRTVEASDAETLTDQVLGWRLPLAGLPDWVQARPVANDGADVVRDSTGRVEEIRQSGWRIEYLAWRDALPVRFKFTREDVEIRLVVDRWVLPP